MTTKPPPAKYVRATAGAMPPVLQVGPGAEPQVLELVRSRTFANRDIDVLRALEREAITQEAARFVKRTPDVRERELEGAVEAWTLVHGVASETYFLAGGVHQRLIQQVERHLSGSFYDRLLRWIEPTKLNARKDDKWARRLARWFARQAFPLAWRETLEFLERSARAHLEIQAQGQLAAAGFAETHSTDLKPKPTQAETGYLAGRLFEALSLPNGPDESAMAEAATKNPILRDAIRLYGEWRTNLNVLSKRNGAIRPDYVAGSDPDSETEAEKELYFPDSPGEL